MVYTMDKPKTLTIPRRRFTREEYYRMAEIGLFNGERVELIEGDIVRMSPVGPLHGEIVTLIAEKLWALFGSGGEQIAPLQKPESPVSVEELLLS